MYEAKKPSKRLGDEESFVAPTFARVPTEAMRQAGATSVLRPRPKVSEEWKERARRSNALADRLERVLASMPEIPGLKSARRLYAAAQARLGMPEVTVDRELPLLDTRLLVHVSDAQQARGDTRDWADTYSLMAAVRAELSAPDAEESELAAVMERYGIEREVRTCVMRALSEEVSAQVTRDWYIESTQPAQRSPCVPGADAFPPLPGRGAKAEGGF